MIVSSCPGQDQRHSITPLLDHPNVQVRINAAYTTLVVSPTEARRTLEVIAEENTYPQMADARLTLRKLDDGSWKSMAGLE